MCDDFLIRLGDIGTNDARVCASPDCGPRYRVDTDAKCIECPSYER